MRLTILIVILTLVATRLNSQNYATDRSSYGIFGGYNFNGHSANFKEFSGYPNCCDKFTGGSGNGFTAGLFYRLPIAPALSASLRAGIFDLSGVLTRNEQITVSGVIPATSLHTLTTSLAMWGVEPIAAYNIFGQLNILGGFRAVLPLSATFSQNETLIQPATGTFENGKRIRNESSDKIPNATQIGFALAAGLSADFPLTRMYNTETGAFSGGFYLSPELIYSLALNKEAVVAQTDWNISTFRVGVSIGYIPGDRGKEPTIQEQQNKPTPQVLTIQPSQLPTAPTAQIYAKGVESDGKETQAVEIRVEEFLSTNFKPLLNYIFFDENSDVIHHRYNRLTPDATSNFNIDNLYDHSVLQTYYDALNIVGKRMRDNSSANITLTGCNADIRDEKGNTSLSKNRAESVKNYLVSVWGIATSRITVIPRNLPEKPSNITDPEGIEENRRVEITSTTRAILEPIIANETFREITPPALRFFTKTTSSSPIKIWRIIASADNNKATKRFDGIGAPPLQLDWDLQRSPEVIAGSNLINYKLSVIDSMGFEASSSGDIHVEHTTIQSKRVNRVKDKIIDRYSLILFDFDKSDIKDMNAYIVDFIRQKTGADAVFTITGYTDRIGDSEHNLRLSTERAKNAARQLGVSNYSGNGENVELYDNSLPEGRFYSREVEIVAERPAK